MTSEVETNIVSVERIQEYSDETPQEAKWNLPNELVPKNWPSKGDIVFKDFQVRYRAGLELVLRGITVFVNGGQKVRIVFDVRVDKKKKDLYGFVLKSTLSFKGRYRR